MVASRRLLKCPEKQEMLLKVEIILTLNNYNILIILTLKSGELLLSCGRVTVIVLSMNFLSILYTHIKIYCWFTPRKMLYCRSYSQETSVSQEHSRFKLIDEVRILPFPLCAQHRGTPSGEPFVMKFSECVFWKARSAIYRHGIITTGCSDSSGFLGGKLNSEISICILIINWFCNSAF